MDATDFARAAYEPSHRPKLVAALKGDPILRDLARARLAQLDEGQQRWQLLDRDHISRMTHQTLTEALRQVDQYPEPPVSVEPMRNP